MRWPRARVAALAVLTTSGFGLLAPLRGEDEKKGEETPSPWEKRVSGRSNAVAAGGGTAATESAVAVGLRWLARHQNDDGSWSAADFTRHCPTASAGMSPGCLGAGQNDYDVGVTGLSLLAFLGAGVTPSSETTYVDAVTEKTIKPGDVVKRGFEWLVKGQKAEGCLSPLVQQLMYNHAIATLALVEASGLTKKDEWKEPAQKAIDFIASAQNKGLGWRYTPRCGRNDTSVTGWCVQAVRAARHARLKVPEACLAGARAWLDTVTGSSGITGYDKVDSGDVIFAGKNEAWASHPTMTATAIFSDPGRHPYWQAKGVSIVVADPPTWDPKARHPTVDYYYWYDGTLALFVQDGPRGPSWNKWNEKVMDVLCQNQCPSKEGCAEGSWRADVDRWGFAGGRVYATAINTLTLEVYYRALPPLEDEKKK